jgi:hypothetical protein
MINWLRRFFAPEEVYVVLAPLGTLVAAHTTLQGATEDTGPGGSVSGGVPLIID